MGTAPRCSTRDSHHVPFINSEDASFTSWISSFTQSLGIRNHPALSNCQSTFDPTTPLQPHQHAHCYTAIAFAHLNKADILLGTRHRSLSSRPASKPWPLPPLSPLRPNTMVMLETGTIRKHNPLVKCSDSGCSQEQNAKYKIQNTKFKIQNAQYCTNAKHSAAFSFWGHIKTIQYQHVQCIGITRRAGGSSTLFRPNHHRHRKDL